MRAKFFILLAVLLALPSQGGAHPGGTDSSGWHHCWTNCDQWGLDYGQYHQHNGGGGTRIDVDLTDDYDDYQYYQHLNQDTHSSGWCRTRYGEGALGGHHTCECKGGYMWNDDETQCIEDGTERKVSDEDRLKLRIQNNRQASLINSASETEEVSVESVVDGDTLRAVINDNRESVRIIGIDTPETVHPSKPVQCFGKEASDKLNELLNGAVIVLVKNPAEDRDKYDRLLRYVELNGEDIGAAMIRDGYAFSYKQYSHPRLEKYNQLEVEARENGRGLWQSCEESQVDQPVVNLVQFTDVPFDHPYSQAITWGKQNKVLNGYSDGTFKPDSVVNRAEFLKIILEAQDIDVGVADEPTGFTDVDEASWYAPYVRYAKQTGVVEGYADGSFRPEEPVNLAEALKIAYSALGVQIEHGDDEVWYQPYWQHATDNSMLFTTELQVEKGVNRKDIVWIIWRLVEKKNQ